ncbi:MAG: glycoside hydrolase family 2 TIM barrel-domain containing protein [Sphaerochaeta sp.]|nr:glycoside hydrolase family 2 TIM barrel-domain containing protein [Sphaerochaeta sp.]
MYRVMPCNDGWLFHQGFERSFLEREVDVLLWEQVELPHTPHQFVPTYHQEGEHCLTFTYRRSCCIDLKEDERLSFRFEGIANKAQFYWDGKRIADHEGSYLPCTVEVGNQGKGVLTVVVDAQEDATFPPYGGSMDYLSFAGIYRTASMLVYNQVHVTSVKVATPSLDTILVEGGTTGFEQGMVQLHLFDTDQLLVKGSAEVQNNRFSYTFKRTDLRLWSVEDPHLFTLKVCLGSEDERVIRFGVRTASFGPEGFFLNGKMVDLVGLNRHQDYPYLGYAAPPSLQVEDARTLKGLGVNLVRTSHYPQDPSFLDACDELGLLVFEEIPGWQYVGKENHWREACLANVRSMIERDCNHPSIILWGVRVNESPDDDELYTKTNALAHELDPYRMTSGVRNLKNSSFHEDVYTFNDFSYVGKGRALLPKKQVCKPESPYLVTEFCGHMYPTKLSDPPRMHTEHALRHYQVLERAKSMKGLSGVIGWCMHDYFTHANFGSGDQICYHGVLDVNRVEKPAAAVYRSQASAVPMLSLLSSFDGGDYPKAALSKAYVATNCEKVRLKYNGREVGVFVADRKHFPNLKHPPVLIDDYIGDRLKDESYLGEAERKRLSKLLGKVGRQGGQLKGLDTIRMALVLLRHKLTYQDAVNMFNTYIGNWGKGSGTWVLEGLIGDEVAISLTVQVGTKPIMVLEASKSELSLDGPTYDMVAIKVRIERKGEERLLPYACIAYKVEVEGPLRLVTPKIDSTKGGCSVIYVRSIGQGGDAVVKVHSFLGDKEVHFRVG